MTTIPSRIALIVSVIDCLLGQTYGDIDLRLYLPITCQRTGGSYDVHDALTARAEADPRFSIRRISTDYGPATKRLGPLEDLSSAASSEETYVITVDDDVLLETHAIEELVAASLRYPGEALGFMGTSNDQFIHAEQLSGQGFAHATPSILGGYRAILYPLWVLDDSLVKDYMAVRERCPIFLDDDHLFAWNLARRGVIRRVIATHHPGPNSGLNFRLLDLPEAMTHGPDSGAGVTHSHRCLIDYYSASGWHFPL